MKNWKVVRSNINKECYIGNSTYSKIGFKSPYFSTVKDNLTKEEAINFRNILNKLRR